MGGATSAGRAAYDPPALHRRPTGRPDRILLGLPEEARLRRRPEDIPVVPGAYVLCLVVTSPLTITIGGATHRLSAGRYLYCGSAYGPGGLRARIARHFRRKKPVRWHIDRLTTSARVRGAFVFPGGEECTLAALLSHLPMPIAGFGSSDCRHCRSHLFYWPNGIRRR